MEKVILTPYSEHEFQQLIKESLSEVLSNGKNLFKEEKNTVLSIDQAAKYLQLSVQTLYGFTSKRKIPFLKKGKKLYFKIAELDAWLETGRKKSRDEIEKELKQK